MLSPEEKDQIIRAKNDFRSRQYRNCFKKLNNKIYFDHLDAEAVSMLLMCTVHLRQFQILKDIDALIGRRVREIDIETVTANVSAMSIVGLADGFEIDIHEAYVYGLLNQFDLWTDAVFKLIHNTQNLKHFNVVCNVIKNFGPKITKRAKSISEQEQERFVSIFEASIAKQNVELFKLLLNEVFIEFFNIRNKCLEIVRMANCILEFDSGSYDLLFLYAQYCFEGGMFDECEKAYLRCLDRYPTDYVALFNLFALYKQNDDLEFSIFYLRKAIVHSPENEVDKNKQQLVELEKIQK